jgi:hypothetical protein
VGSPSAILFVFARETDTTVLDLEPHPDVGTAIGRDAAIMVFLEDPKMIFADMRLHATSTPTAIPTRYHHHHRKYRAQNNNDCTAIVRFLFNKRDNVNLVRDLNNNSTFVSRLIIVAINSTLHPENVMRARGFRGFPIKIYRYSIYLSNVKNAGLNA